MCHEHDHDKGEYRVNRWRNLTSFIAFAMLIVWLASSVSAQDRDAMIAEAKKEKVFVYYSTTDIRDGTAMVHAFQKKYPFVEPKLLRLGSTQVVVKVLQEHRGGVHLFDVISATSFQFYEIHKEGLFQRYDSPERRAFADDFKDKEADWVSAYHNASVVSYNTNLVKPQELPRSYDDLLASQVERQDAHGQPRDRMVRQHAAGPRPGKRSASHARSGKAGPEFPSGTDADHPGARVR